MNTQEIFMCVVTTGIAMTLSYMGGRRANYWYLNLALFLGNVQAFGMIFA